MIIKRNKGRRAAMMSLAALTATGITASPLRVVADAASPATISAAGQDTPTYADGSDKDGKKDGGKGDKGGSEPIIIGDPIIKKDKSNKKG